MHMYVVPHSAQLNFHRISPIEVAVCITCVNLSPLLGHLWRTPKISHTIQTFLFDLGRNFQIAFLSLKPNTSILKTIGEKSFHTASDHIMSNISTSIEHLTSYPFSGCCCPFLAFEWDLILKDTSVNWNPPYFTASKQMCLWHFSLTTPSLTFAFFCSKRCPNTSCWRAQKKNSNHWNVQLFSQDLSAL